MRYKAVLFDMNGVLTDNGVRSYDGVEDCIKAFLRHGCKLAVVTSMMKGEAELVLENLGFASYFSAVIGAEDVTRIKPDPEGYRKGAAELSVKPNECIVIEDTPGGISAAKGAGMRAVAVLNTHSSEELHDADIIIPRLSSEFANSLADGI